MGGSFPRVTIRKSNLTTQPSTFWSNYEMEFPKGANTRPPKENSQIPLEVSVPKSKQKQPG